MGRIALIAALLLAGCAGKQHAVFIDRPVEVKVPTPVPCVDAADRRPRPTALADEAMPATAKQLVGTLLAKLKEWSRWGTLASSQLDACTKE